MNLRRTELQIGRGRKKKRAGCGKGKKKKKEKRNKTTEPDVTDLELHHNNLGRR